MAIDRRSLLIAGAALSAGLPTGAQGSAPALFAATRLGTDGRFSAAIFDETGRDVRAVLLPARGHDLTVCPKTRRCVAFARRPGNFAAAFSTDAAMEPIAFTTPENRHFYGHGVFSPDGRVLYATENDFEAGRGVIGLYDANNRFRRIGEHSTFGIGPHDLVLLRHAPVLAVVNGGLREHPSFGGGRRVLNAGAIEASLVYIDMRTGELLERHDLAKGGKVSLRHLDIGSDDTVVIGAQLEKGAEALTPLVFTHRRQTEISAHRLPDDLTRRLRGYISSVAVNRRDGVAAVTSSKGAMAVLLEIATGRVLRTMELADVSGVAPGANSGFVLTTGHGVVVHADLSRATPMRKTTTVWQWDNHATIVSE